MELLQVRHPSGEAARTRLIAFPHAGGDTVMFRDWRKLLAPEIELAAVRLPGRGTRIDEPLPRDLMALAEDIAAGLKPDLPPSWGLFGHSFGAILAFEVARILAERWKRPPDYLVVSASEPPQNSWNPRPQMHQLDEEAFLDHVLNMGGVPAEIQPHREILDIISPIIRADIQCLETYRYREGPLLNVPTLVMGGREDGRVRKDHLVDWTRVVSGKPHLRFFSGGHFYYHEHLPEVMAFLKDWILQQLK